MKIAHYAMILAFVALPLPITTIAVAQPKPATAAAAALSACKAVGARLDPTDPNALLLPVPATYVGRKPAKPIVYQRKIPVRTGPWELSYCDADEAGALSVSYGPAADALPLYRSCNAGMLLTMDNSRLPAFIDGMEAGGLRSSGLSGVVRSRTQAGTVSGQPATYYRLSGIRRFTGTPSKQDSGLVFGTEKAVAGAAQGNEPVIWWISVWTEVGKPAACLAVHTAVSDPARSFPLATGERAVVDPRTPGPLSNLNLP